MTVGPHPELATEVLRVTLHSDGTVTVWLADPAGTTTEELAETLRWMASGFEAEPRRIG